MYVFCESLCIRLADRIKRGICLAKCPASALLCAGKSLRFVVEFAMQTFIIKSRIAVPRFSAHDFTVSAQRGRERYMLIEGLCWIYAFFCSAITTSSRRKNKYILAGAYSN